MYRLNYFSQLAFIVLLFALVSCSPGVNPSSYPNPAVASLSPTELPEVIQLMLTPRAAMTLTYTPTPDLSSTPLPTETLSAFEPTPIQLPEIWENVNREYCDKPHPVFLPISEAKGLTDDDIVKKLMSLFLDYYNNPQAPGYCQIDGYRIESVSYDERTPYLPLEPKGDIMRGVAFSIKLIQVPNAWMSLSGEIDQQNWLHTGVNMAVFRSKDGYRMAFANP